MRALAVLSLVVLVGLAGCISPADPGGGPDDGGDGPPSVDASWARHALNNSRAHDHDDPAQHRNLSTPNFREIGWDPLITAHHNRTSGGYMCGDTATDGDRKLAVTHSFSSDVAFVVADVTDPEDPEKVGELVLKNVHVYDVAVVPDGSYVALATSQSGSGENDTSAGVAADRTTTIQPVFRDACGNTFQGPAEEVPYRSGIVLVDIADPASPAVVDYRAQPALGAHSVFATTIDGTRYVLGAATNLQHQTSYFSFYTIEDSPAGGKLLEYGVYDAQYPGPEGQAPLVNGHVDGWIQQHPKTNETLAYLANWNGGVIIVRLEGRGQITTVGHWNDYRTEEGTSGVNLARQHGQIHEALPMETLWNGTHYTFIGQEVIAPPEGRPTGQVIMLDTTDPASPEPVARWTLPVDVEWGDVGNESLLFSTHYIEVVERTLFVTLYHGGVWAVDVELPVPTELRTLGVYLPTKVSPRPPGDLAGSFDWTPTVLEARALDDGQGTLSVFDATSGIYNVRFDRSVEVPVPDPWTQDTWIER